MDGMYDILITLWDMIMHFFKYSYVLEFCIFLVTKLLMQHSRKKHVYTNQNHFICLLIFYVLNMLYLDNSYSLLL
jgi:hypothetical protein